MDSVDIVAVDGLMYLSQDLVLKRRISDDVMLFGVTDVRNNHIFKYYLSTLNKFWC